ncbi:hypothetical protein QQP08_001460 [Theobroma cacao]|uniref:Uncharacterized protein n=1 Tax=Theobroma cacao TaxID=3641 RepID=A0A061E0J3_THECC|nr:Uncharacterized protein TCM_005189 [Theobroma cacao]WRX08973.1 hypothetical protein QQP08_001460 [Theobroma cacao]
MKRLSETKEENEDAAAFAVWDCGSPLYDSYELVTLSHLIERNLMKLPSLGGAMRQTTRFSHPSDVTPATSSDSTSVVGAKESFSLLSSFGKFVGSKFWKRRSFGQGRDKPKMLRKGLSCFCNGAGFSKK